MEMSCEDDMRNPGPRLSPVAVGSSPTLPPVGSFRTQVAPFQQTPSYEVQMKPRITVITLGVDDLARSVRFYRDGLGLNTPGIVGEEFEFGAVAFFDLQGGIRLALWPRSSISNDSGVPVAPASPTDFTLGHNVSAKGEVNLVIDQARQAGAEIVKEPHQTFWGGYAGYFADPDGHLWEIVWNPAWEA